MAANIQTIKFLGCSVISFNSSIGFNGNPSTLSVTLVEDTQNGDKFYADNYALDNELGAATGGAAFSSGNPGTYAKFATPDGNFKFFGFVTSYRRSKGVTGVTINVELSDPRFLLSNIPLINNVNTKINTTNFITDNWNILCAPAIFDNPIDLDWNSSGVRFDKLARAIEGRTYTFYQTLFAIEFHESFYSQLVGGYRLKQQVSTVEDAINQAAKEANIDWFLEMDEVNGIQVAYIKGIKRKSQYSLAGDNGLKTFINDRIDRVTNWEIGRELRQDPTVTIVLGDKVRSLWNTSPGGNYPLLCELGNGIAIDRPFICLDFLRSYGFDNLPTVQMTVSQTGTTVNIAGTDAFGNNRRRYPIRSKSQPLKDRKGYIATEVVLRAALNGKDSWQTAVWYTYTDGAGGQIPITFDKHNSFDLGFGFGAPTAQEQSVFTLNPALIGIKGPAFDFDTGQSIGNINQTSNALEETLKEAVYQATRRCAEEYYGKKFICRLPYSKICSDIGVSYEHNQKKIPIEYDLVDAAPPFANYDSTAEINFPDSLVKSDGKNFRNPNGLYKPFFYLSHAEVSDGNNQVLYEYLDPNSCAWAHTDVSEQSLENTTLYYSGISVETYRYDPRFAIITMNEPVMLGVDTYRKVTPQSFTNGAITSYATNTVYSPVSKTDRSGCFLEFLSRVFSGFTLVLSNDSSLNSGGVRVNVNRAAQKVSVDHYYSLQSNAISLSTIVGLSEIRLASLNDVGGFFIPLQWNYIRYGPWVAGNSVTRPVSVIEDTRLNPWSYGNYSVMNEAGAIIAQRANNETHTIAYATVSVEGYPEFSLGYDLLEQDAVMASLSDLNMSFGIEGVKTTYKFKTFFGPNGFTKRSEIDLISQNSFSSASNKNSINVQGIFDNIEEQIYNMSGGSQSTSVASMANNLGTSSLTTTINTKNANPNITAKPASNVKSTNESNNSNYADTVQADYSSLYTPVTTRPASTVKGKVATIEGGHL